MGCKKKLEQSNRHDEKKLFAATDNHTQSLYTSFSFFSVTQSEFPNATVPN